MLEASFDAQRSRGASISGAYQYDTGQRIRMYGLPTPEEFADMDESLNGEAVTVQAQYGYSGDSQSEPRLAQYEEDTGAWLAEVPDVYLTHAEPVHVYVYVMYGSDEEKSRSKTMYTGSFTPISRPAPSTAITPDQLNAWDALVAEVNLTLTKMNTAISNANAAVANIEEIVSDAKNSAQAAKNAANAASSAATLASKWGNATASADTLSPGSDATVSVTENAQGNKHITYGIPRGEKGEKGDTGPAGVTFRLKGATLYIDTV